MNLKDIESAAEAILFASGDPMTLERLSAALETDAATVRQVVDRLADHYSYDRRGIRLVKLDDSYQMTSAPEYAHQVRRAMETRRPPQLSQAALESLSVVAYFQPTTKAYVEQVRGVDSSYTMGLLADRGLIEECGRLSVPGRPILYRTTQTFLRSFGLKSLDELPELPDSDAEDQISMEGLALREMQQRAAGEQQPGPPSGEVQG